MKCSRIAATRRSLSNKISSVNVCLATWESCGVASDAKDNVGVYLLGDFEAFSMIDVELRDTGQYLKTDWINWNSRHQAGQQSYMSLSTRGQKPEGEYGLSRSLEIFVCVEGFHDCPTCDIL